MTTIRTRRCICHSGIDVAGRPPETTTRVTRQSPPLSAASRYAQSPARRPAGRRRTEDRRLTVKTPQRVFLGWSPPGLEAAARWVVQHRAVADSTVMLDLSGTAVVVPGTRAGRQMLNHLIALAEQSGRSLVPPQIMTLGQLLELLCPPARPPAGRLHRMELWARAVKALDQPRRAALVRSAPPIGDHPAWLRLGAALDALHTDLAGHGRSFADVASACPARADTPRWETLAEVQRDFLREIERAGFSDPPTSALAQLSNGMPAPNARVVLVAITEIPELTATVLRANTDRVTALIVAPSDRSAHFDDLGRPLYQEWGSTAIDISPQSIHTVDRPEHQADAAVEALAALENRYATDQVVIGVPDAEVIPCLLARSSCPGGVPMRSATGTEIRRTGPFRLMLALRTFAAGGLFRDWATLLRHPAIERYLALQARRGTSQVESWLAVLDDYAACHVPHRLTDRWLCSGSSRITLETLCNSTRDLLGPLWPDADAPTLRPLAQWAEPILTVLRRVFGAIPLSADLPADRTTIQACGILRDAAEELSILPESDERLTAGQALGVFLLLAEDSSIPSDPDPAAVELLGWLELPFDEAPAVIVTGMNEGSVPRNRPPQPLLPESLRNTLGLPGIAEHAARDAYLLTVLVQSRRDLTFIAGRRTRRDDPLMPSRLLFACGDAELPARVRRYVTASSGPPRRLPSPIPGLWTGFSITPRCSFDPITELRVTAFRSYLRSPYGFFLEHVRRLEECTDRIDDLNPASFGTMVHETLREFASGPDSDSDHPETIRAALRSALDAYIAHTFGSSPPVAVRLQRAQAAERLDQVAVVQSDRRKQGWRIVQREWSPPGGAVFDVDGDPIILKGSIDRIDRNDQTGHYTILDYKTSDKAEQPDTAHRSKGGQWIDLQLPLYRHLAAPIVAGAPVEMAYLVIPGQPGAVKLVQAEWSEADLLAADEAARDVVRRIRAGDLFDLGDNPPERGILGAICGLDLVVPDDDEAGEEEVAR